VAAAFAATAQGQVVVPPAAVEAAQDAAAEPSAEPVVDSVPRTWALTGSMATPRSWHAWTTLADGKVLVTGGLNAGVILASSELYDLTTGTFTPTGSMTVPRFGHSAVLLADGRVLVVGGRNTVTPELASAEIYDPATGRFTPTTSSRVGRLHAEAIPLLTGKALVIGGYTTSCELFDPATETFSETGSLHTARALFSATRLSDGTVLAAGTYPSQNSAETYDPATGVWTTTGPMIAGRSEYPPGVLLDDGRILLAGGTFGRTSEVYNPTTRTFARTGDMAQARHNYPLVKLADGTVLAAGGDPGGYVPTAISEIFDPAIGTWNTTGAMVVRRFAHEGVLLRNGQVLVFGGTTLSGDAASAEVFSPPVTGLASVELSKTLVSGCLSATGKVTLTGPAPAGGFTVLLHSGNPHAVVPTQITFKEGIRSKAFKVVTQAVEEIETATIEASMGDGRVSATVTLTPMGVRLLLLSPNPVAGGGSVAGIVALPCAAGPGDITVSLSSTKPDIAAPTTATVTVPVGTNFLPFEVTTTPVTAETKPQIKATANGVTKSKTLVVNPAP
jgi:hypothetical protein